MGLFILARLLLVEICQFCEKQEQVCLAPEVIGLGQLSVFQEMINVFCDQFRRGSRFLREKPHWAAREPARIPLKPIQA